MGRCRPSMPPCRRFWPSTDVAQPQHEPPSSAGGEPIDGAIWQRRGQAHVGTDLTSDDGQAVQVYVLCASGATGPDIGTVTLCHD